MISTSSWMKKSPTARAQSLYSLAKGLESRKKELAATLSIANALSPDAAEKEVDLSSARLSDWAAYCDKIQGGTLVRGFIQNMYILLTGSVFFCVCVWLNSSPQLQPLPQSGCALSIPEALGVVGLVLPDRNPLLSMVTLLGAAVATGNAVVMVPSQMFPLAALAFVQASDKEFGATKQNSNSKWSLSQTFPDNLRTQTIRNRRHRTLTSLTFVSVLRCSSLQTCLLVWWISSQEKGISWQQL